VELRQYTLHAGARERLIRVFEDEFIEPQEALGMDVFGPFYDLGDPNRFVWMRGFTDMDARREALASFYDGPVWLAHCDVANVTMVDSDNVLLLRPAGSLGDLGGDVLVVANIHYVESGALEEEVQFFERAMKPLLEGAGARVLAVFETEAAANTFARLPVREGGSVLVWLAAFRDEKEYRAHVLALRDGADWREQASASVLCQLARKPEVLMLAPTPRARLQGRGMG
jgi:NIPSNAP